MTHSAPAPLNAALVQQNMLRFNSQPPSAIVAEIATRLADRLTDTNRTFENIVNVSCDAGAMEDLLKVETRSSHNLQEATYDAVVANLLLPWSDDPQTLLKACGRALRGDGLLLFSSLGPATGQELHSAWQATALPVRASRPLPDVQDIGQILSNLKFALPVVDRDVISLSYPDIWSLLSDLKQHGMLSATGKGLVKAGHIERLNKHYPQNADGSLPFTLEVIYGHGWRPHKTQQQPLKPGNYKVKLTDVL